MWILKLHFAISILCLLTFVGFRRVGKEAIKNNGYESDDKKKKGITAYWIFFIPLLNIMAVSILLVMIGTKKSDLDKWAEEQRRKKEEGNKK